MTDLSGQYIDRYHIIEPLGQGGMATVYRGYDTRLEREVAIKLIRTEMFGQTLLEQVLKRFEREARALAKLDHPHIVHVYDYGEYRGSPYLVMQYLPGGTLKQGAGYRMPFQEAAALLAPMAEALAFAHQAGVIHRDVKPANILTTQGGQPMLTDFGIAKILESEQTTQLTGKGVGVGTPEYMAPEQWNGQVVHQTDIYSLGVVFYELVTGVRPYVADTPVAVLLKQVSEPLPRPRLHVPDLPEAVERVIFKALAKNPLERYKNMQQFGVALSQLASGDISVRDKAQTTQHLQTLTHPGSAPPVQKEARAVQRSDTPLPAPPRQAEILRQTPTQQPPSPLRPLPQEAPPQTRVGKKPFFRSRWFLFAGLGLFLVIALICLGVGGLAYLPDIVATINGEDSTLGTEAQLALELGVLQTLTVNAIDQGGVDESDPAANPPAAAQAHTQTPVETQKPAAVTPTETLIPPTATSALRESAQVYWDLSRIPRKGSDGTYEPSDLFSELGSALRDANINLQSGSNDITSLNLDQYDTLVVCATSSYGSPYSAAEAAAIGEYVKRGGGLIILAEDSTFSNNIAQVAAYFDFSVAQSTGVYDVKPGSSQSITEGISSLYFYNGGSIKTGSTESTLLSQTSGSGRLVVIGDSNLFDNRWLTKVDNKSFALNVFRWAAFMKD
jgi:serine/threonine protein kinase